MCDEYGCDVLVRHKLQDLVLQGLPCHRVERTEGLVHKQQFRVLRETPCDLHALLHSTRQLARKLIFCLAQAHSADQFVDNGTLLCGGDIPRFQAERHVAAHGAPGQQRL